MKMPIIKRIFPFFFLAGSLISQNQKMVVLDDGTKLYDGNIYSFQEEINNQKLLSPMACASAANLVTFYATNNAQRGHMFDIQAINAVTILCFDMNFSAGTSNVEIYTKTGTHVGFQTNAAAWTLIGTANNVASAGVNVATAIPIAVNQGIGAGATRAFYITRTTAGGPTVAYTNGTAVGNVLASNADIRILEGTGKEYAFGTNYTPRQFNGAVYYNPGALPIEFLSFDAKHYGKVVNLNWSTATEKNNAYFTVERSFNGKTFESLKQIEGALNSQSVKNYTFNDENPLSGLSYYRIKQTDVDGKWSYSEMKAVSFQKNINDLELGPIPSNASLNLSFKAIESGSLDVFIYNMKGERIYSSDLKVENGINQTIIDINHLGPGIYQLILANESELIKSKFIKE